MKVYIIRSTSVYQAYLISRSSSSRSFSSYTRFHLEEGWACLFLSAPLHGRRNRDFTFERSLSLSLSFSPTPCQRGGGEGSKRKDDPRERMNEWGTDVNNRRRETGEEKEGREFRGNIINGDRAKTRRVLLRARTFRFWPYIARLTTLGSDFVGGGENSNLRRGTWDYGWNQFEI